MKDYFVYYHCPHCPRPCCENGEYPNANEGVVANSKAEAREIFNQCKPCRWQKITRIVERKPGFEIVSVEANGKKYSSLEDALEAIF